MSFNESLVEHVVLVDEENTVIGIMPKSDVHQKETPLHRAFSSFIFRVSDGKFLLQQRSSQKKTWPLMWSNSCCGHPAFNESNISAAYRRLDAELGLRPMFLEEVAPYRYCFSPVLPYARYIIHAIAPAASGSCTPLSFGVMVESFHARWSIFGMIHGVVLAPIAFSAFSQRPDTTGNCALKS